MKKNILKLTLILISIFFMTGCSDSELVHEHCTRNVTTTDGVEASLTYEIYYKEDVMKKLEAIEEIKSDDSATLDTYENSYKTIHANYEGLKYYDASVERKNNTIISKIVINYARINIDELINVEGEEDNIFENKIPKASKWKELAKKIGTTCEAVTE